MIIILSKLIYLKNRVEGLLMDRLFFHVCVSDLESEKGGAVGGSGVLWL